MRRGRGARQGHSAGPLALWAMGRDLPGVHQPRGQRGPAALGSTLKGTLVGEERSRKFQGPSGHRQETTFLAVSPTSAGGAADQTHGSRQVTGKERVQKDRWPR